MKRSILALLTGFILVSAARARIGDTKEELDVRYGAPVNKVESTDPRVDRYSYKAAGFTVVVDLFDGKSAAEAFTKPGPINLISDDEIAVILKANGREKPWVPDTLVTMKSWKLSDRSMSAIYAPLETPPILGIRSADYADYMEVKGKEKAAQKLKGF